MELIDITRECASDYRDAASRVRGQHLRNCLLLCADQRDFFAEMLRRQTPRYNEEVERLQSWRDLGSAWRRSRTPMPAGDAAIVERLTGKEAVADGYYRLALEAMEFDDPIAILIRAQRSSVLEDREDVEGTLPE
jgi:hypothetical protein